MAGSMGRMFIGVSGLQANQYAMNTTAHNLANLETEGYSRQQVLMTDTHYQKIHLSAINTSQTGTGTKYKLSRQLRDDLLDRSYRLENGRQNYYETMYNNIYEVQDYFGELQGSTFQSNMEDLWTSLQELSKDTNNVTNRSAFIAYAGNFVTKANEIYESLVSYQENMNFEIEEQVKKINDLAETIFKLNQEVVKVEGGNIEKANDYKDQRNQALDELSAIIDVDVHENGDGSIDVFVENRVLVTTSNVFKMETVPVEPGSPLVKPVWKDDQSNVIDTSKIPSAAIKTDVGSLKGLLMSRGYELPNYLDVPIDGTQAEIDNYNMNLEPYSIANIIAQFDVLINGIVTAINDKLCPNKEVTLDDGTTITILDEDIAGVGMGEGNEIPGTELFVRTGSERYTERQVVINGETVTVKEYNAEDPSDRDSLYTVGYIKLNDELVNNPSLLPFSTLDGGEAQDKVKDLLDLWDAEFTRLNPDSLVNETFSSYYAAMIDDFANRAYTYDAIAKSAEQATFEYDNARQQQLGVSSDEELTNLIKFQQAYNASSRYITVVSEMLEHIIEKLGS